ncbi:NAD(P)H-hydrate dehydratase [Undibacterium sp. RTI2.2]|nr:MULTISPECIES: NAD(P)H-hydrate dehydratase [unclassified Undibacterium]MDY7537111.1 NAD(P)H-hydrate dehydratase [Undibacterium sp. 5I1]MEB0115135.1 NAD(P)H-hydrate dehydratase [Undibacterium sp. RTI2.2]MEB0229289.1 NAD(P)H-hydrate dehydratase [Undibacterium sp. 10I3]MEB0256163.1 NAD(P)H-hydrate dehydratase [Undibacterium sp. 5I1]
MQTDTLSSSASLPISFSALYSTEEIRAIESASLVTSPKGNLMHAAGVAAAALAKTLIANHPAIPTSVEPTASSTSNSIDVLVLAGPGNNGGDALQVAYLLAASGERVSVIITHGIEHYSAEAKESLVQAQSSQAHFFGLDYLAQTSGKRWSLVIDGLFGIGLTRPIEGKTYALIQQLNQYAAIARIPVLALDVPSGLDADTGQVIGRNGIAVRATHTITFIANKPGLYTAAGKDYAGIVKVADLGIEPSLYPTPQARLCHPATLMAALSPRRQDSHKGNFGDVFVIGGADGMAGAALLSSRAALHCGAGRVFIGSMAIPPLTYDPINPELMCRNADDVHFKNCAIVIGPGLGLSDKARLLLEQCLQEASAIVIDADALNLIANNGSLQLLAHARSGKTGIPAKTALNTSNKIDQTIRTILTPHPLEAARLLGISAEAVQADRLQSARKLMNKFNATVILKGSGTIIATPDEQIIINTSGNPALAAGGTGDVLAGICGALLAQGLTAQAAAGLAVWLHGKAADLLVEQGIGPVGLTASELIMMVRHCINRHD